MFLPQIDHAGTPMVFWEIGGGDKICPLWRQYFQNMDALMLFVDATNRDFLMDARREIVNYVFTDDLPVDCPILVAANMQDLARAMSAEEVRKALNLEELVGKRRYKVLGTSGIRGEGMAEALDWIVENVKVARNARK